MSERRAFAIWRHRDQAARNVRQQIVPWCRQMLQRGRVLQVDIRLHRDAKADRQRAYYHGVVLKQIALQAMPHGVRHDLAVWKEYFRAEFLGFKTVTVHDPLRNKKRRRRQRISSEDLGIRGYQKLIERVMAFAVSELGVVFTMDWATYEAAYLTHDMAPNVMPKMTPNIGAIHGVTS